MLTLSVPPDSAGPFERTDVRRLGRSLGLAMAERKRSDAFMAPSSAKALSARVLSACTNVEYMLCYKKAKTIRIR
jgi:hypothetical protein